MNSLWFGLLGGNPAPSRVALLSGVGSAEVGVDWVVLARLVVDLVVFVGLVVFVSY